jgi:hypothetical protein
MRRSIQFALAAALAMLGLGTGCAHHHHHDYDNDDHYDVVRFEDCPQPVRDHFYRDHPGVDVREVRIEHEGGEDHYHFQFDDHGAHHETEYHREGDEIRSEYR